MTRDPAQASTVQKERSMVLQKQLIAGLLRVSGTGTRRGKASRFHVCSRQFDRTAAVLRSATDPAGNQRATVRHAQAFRQLHCGSGEARAQRRCLHLCEMRHRHAEVGQRRSHRRKTSPIPTCCCSPTRDASRFSSGSNCCARSINARWPCSMCPTSRRDAFEPHHVDYVVQQLRTEVIPKLEQVSGRRYDEDSTFARCWPFGPGRRRFGLGVGVGQTCALADRRLLRRRVLHRADVHRLPWNGGGSRVLPRLARRDGGPSAAGPGSADSGGHRRRRNVIVW